MPAAAFTQVVPDIHIMVKGYELVNGPHMPAICSGVQGGELVCVPAVHLVLQLTDKQIYELHPALFSSNVDGCSAFLRTHPGGATQFVQLANSSRAVPGCCTVQGCAAVSVFCSRVSTLKGKKTCASRVYCQGGSRLLHNTKACSRLYLLLQGQHPARQDKMCTKRSPSLATTVQQLCTSERRFQDRACDWAWYMHILHVAARLASGLWLHTHCDSIICQTKCFMIANSAECCVSCVAGLTHGALISPTSCPTQSTRGRLCKLGNSGQNPQIKQK